MSDIAPVRASKPSDTRHADDFVAAVRVSDVDAATERCI